MKTSTTVLVSALLTSFGFSLAQTGQAQAIRLYTTADGLCSSHINELHFDEQDFLWVCSSEGLARYDGGGFISYPQHRGASYQLNCDGVLTMHTSADSSHWIGGTDGLYYLCRTRNSFTYYPIEQQRSDISVSCIYDHPYRPHTLIIGTYGWGLRVFDTSSRTFDIEQSNQLNQTLGTTDMSRFHIDRQGRLWAFGPTGVDVLSLVDTVGHLAYGVTTTAITLGQAKIESCAEDTTRRRLYMGAQSDGVFVADLDAMQVSRLDLPNGVNRITALKMTPDGHLLIGTEGQGLWDYDIEHDRVSRAWADEHAPLNRAKIHSIAIDGEQNLWLGLYQKGVLFMRSPASIFACQPIGTEPGMSVGLGCVTAFAAMADGRRAYGIDGAGVVVQQPGRPARHYHMGNSPMATDAVLSLYAEADGTLLVGTYQHGLYVIGADGTLRRSPAFTLLDNASVIDIVADSTRHQLCIGTNGSGIYFYSPARQALTGMQGNADGLRWVTALHVAADDRLWIGTADHVKTLDLSTMQVSVPRQTQAKLTVHSVTEDSSGQLWMASSMGLIYYDAQRDSLCLVDDEQPAQNMAYETILTSPDGLLWMSRTGCVVARDPRSGHSTRYLDPAIAATGTMSPRAAICWPDGTFSFGGDGGALNFDPVAVANYKHPARPLYLRQLWVENVPTDYDPALTDDHNVLDQALWCAHRLTLPEGRASFSVAYTLQDYGGSAGITYSYRLKGYETAWQQNHGSEQTASYQSLPSGRYILQIRAEAGGSSDYPTAQRELEVYVVPYWWHTWWAWLLWLMLACAACAVIWHHWRTHDHERRALRRAQLSRRLKEEKLNMLTSVSHEIKTPLTLIIAPLRKMLGRKTDPATHSVLETMYRNSLRILMLVNQQMDIRKLDHGQLKLRISELPLRSFISDQMLYFANTALSRHINYTLTMPEGHDDMTLWADPSQLDKVVVALLSNAIKYVPDQGAVSINVTEESTEDRPRTVCISIYNSGSHLPEEQQAAAFSGIGLHLAREITELHHGTLTVRNSDEGVAFEIRLLTGNSHFSPEQMAAPGDATTHLAQLPSDTDELDGNVPPQFAPPTTPEQDVKEKELVEQLEGELRAKNAQRERRQGLGFDYSQMKMSSADDKLMRRVVDAIHKNLSDSDFSVEALADEVGISRVHLNRRLKELIGTSPSTLIKSVRLKQAAYLLIQGGSTVAEVAYSVGFSSPAYFTSNFSQYFGMTPKEFTNTYTENPNSPELKRLLEQ